MRAEVIVDAFNALLRAAVSGYARLFDALPPMAGLALLSVVIGIGMLWVVGKTSDQRAIQRAKKLMQAYLLEMRLYRDEPGLLFRAQGSLLRNNARYLGHMLRPALFLALPMIVLYAHFDAVYGRRALVPGESALLSAFTSYEAEDLSLAASGPFAVDSVSVAVPRSEEVVWRIRATGQGRGEFALSTPDGIASKSAIAGPRSPYVSAVAAGAWWERVLLAPGEVRLGPEGVAAMAIDYPSEDVGIAGLQAHWVVWFLGISILSAYLLKGLFGVVL